MVRNFIAPPFTDSGKASIIPGKPPFEYAGDYIVCTAKADPESLSEIVPKPLIPTDEVYFSIRNFITVIGDNLELFHSHPELTQYMEAVVAVKVNYKGETHTYYPFTWVDKDFALMRGNAMGYPKKLADIQITKLHPLMSRYNTPKQGIKVGGYVSRGGERLFDIGIDLANIVDKAPTFGKLLTIRFFPIISNGEVEKVDLLQLEGTDFKYSDVWKGDATLNVNPTFNEELDKIRISKITGGYYYSSSFRTVGLTFREDISQNGYFFSKI